MRASRRKEILFLALALSVFIALATFGLAQTAPDATEKGSLAIQSAEYQFPATMDGEILAGRATEIWARVYHPTDLSQGPFPLVVFLHGNHATCGVGSNPRRDTNCQYTTSGTCPPGTPIVVPNHLGYGYLADRLASWGYLVVSINANRGITCGMGVTGDNGLNLARGRLILKHLQKLSEWNQGLEATPSTLGVDLAGKLDFNYVGLMGHSRGGEGARAAYMLYLDAESPWPGRIPDPVNFQAIYEIGAVDGQTSRVLNAMGAVWNQLLPMCDGDVSNLQGVRPYDRMMMNGSAEEPATQKSTYTVWGTNHNFYNTEWQQSDSTGCLGHSPIFPSSIGSPQQQQVGMASLLAFFRGNVGPYADPTFNQNFNPQYELPAAVTSVTRVDRGFTDTPNSLITTVLDDFNQPTGFSTYGVPNIAGNITYAHGSNPRHSVPTALISWQGGTNDRFFQTNWAEEGTGYDISGYQTLDIRLARQNSALNPSTPTDFIFSLVGADETLYGAIPLSALPSGDLRGPVGGPGGLHPILQTVRIPLPIFKADLTQIRGLRLTFNQTTSGAIYLANVRFSVLSGLGAAQAAGDNFTSYYPPQPQFPTAGNIAMNVIYTLRTVSKAAALDGESAVEIEVLSTEPFPVRDELAILRIGEKNFGLSRYPESGDTHALIFSLTGGEYAGLASGEPVAVQYGREFSNKRWLFGRLDKNQLDR